MKSNLSKKNFIYNTIGLSAYTFTSFFLFVIVKLINNSNIAGIFTFAFSITTLFFYISLYFNRTFQVANNQYKFKEYLCVRIVACILSFLLLIVFSLISKFDFYKIMVIVLLMVFRIIDSISDCFYGLMQSNNRLYQVGISYLLKSAIGIILFIITDLLTKDLLLAIVSLIIVNLLVFILYDLNCYKKINIKDNKVDNNAIKKIVINALFVFLFSFISVYLINSQKIIITYFSSNDLQTIFGILIMPATLLSLIGTYIIQPFSMKFIELLKSNDLKNFNGLTIKINLVLFAIGIAVIAVSYFIGIPLLNFIYQINLDMYKNELLIILCGSLFIANSIVFSNILTILNCNKIQVVIYFTSSVFASLLCVLLRGVNVIYGASISYIISSGILLLLFIYVYYFIIKRKKEEI